MAGTVCAMCVRDADGYKEKREYDSFAVMKHDARDVAKHNGAVLYWWCELSELRLNRDET